MEYAVDAAANEAIDKLRAYVSQTWLSRGATTIAVTSPIGDEGKAFAAFGLASSLAQAGYKTLLVDFDLREPALHAYAGVANLAGVCELLRAETDMRALPGGATVRREIGTLDIGCRDDRRVLGVVR